MPKAKVTDLKTKVIKAVENGAVTMRPRAFFIAGSALSLLGLLISSVTLVFALYLARFALTHPGPGAERKLSLLLTSLPWYIPALAVISLIGGLLLLRRYDFSYKKHFGYILAIIIVGLWLGSSALEHSRIEEFLTTRGYFRQLYQQNSPRPAPPNFPKQGRGGRYR